MTAKVRFFASLQQQLSMESIDIDVRPGMSAADVWDLATSQRERPAKMLCAINLEYASLQQPVSDGDEIAFFPPVTGG